MSAVCCKCNEVIEHRVVHAMGKQWHPKHFVCHECQKPIEDATYAILNDTPICIDCHERNHIELCCCCDMPIKDQRSIIAVGDKWHENCFRCCVCGTPLVDSEYFEVNGYIFCEKDFRAYFSARCAGCCKPIVDRAVVALNTKWHPECFKCVLCNRIIEPGKFAIQKGRAVCPQCCQVRKGCGLLKFNTTTLK